MSTDSLLGFAYGPGCYVDVHYFKGFEPTLFFVYNGQNAELLRACHNPIRPCGTRRNVTRLFMAVPFVSRQNYRVWVHPESWALPAKSLRTITFYACHGTATACCAQNMSTSLCYESPSNNASTVFVPGRSGRSVLLKKKKGSNTYSSSS